MPGMYENVVPHDQRKSHDKRGWLVADSVRQICKNEGK